MLWLAGLMGIIGAGAASVVAGPFPTDADQPEDDDPRDQMPEEDHGDLLDEIDGLPASGNSQFPSLLSDLDALGDRQPDAFAQPSDDIVDLEDLPGGSIDAPAPDPAPLLLTDLVAPATSGASLLEIDPWPEAWAEPDTDAQSESYEQPAALGDWVTQGPPAEVLDYDAGTDSLVLVWDDLAGKPDEPSVRVESDPYDAEVMHVMMNDASVAEVYGDPDLNTGDITMIPLSSALIVGLEPA